MVLSESDVWASVSCCRSPSSSPTLFVGRQPVAGGGTCDNGGSRDPLLRRPAESARCMVGRGGLFGAYDCPPAGEGTYSDGAMAGVLLSRLGSTPRVCPLPGVAAGKPGRGLIPPDSPIVICSTGTSGADVLETLPDSTFPPASLRSRENSLASGDGRGSWPEPWERCLLERRPPSTDSRPGSPDALSDPAWALNWGSDRTLKKLEKTLETELPLSLPSAPFWGSVDGCAIPKDPTVSAVPLRPRLVGTRSWAEP